MVYGLVRCTLDDFSRLDTRWVPDLDSIRFFVRRDDRDEVLELLNRDCDAYESFRPIDVEPIKHADVRRMRKGCVLPPEMMCTFEAKNIKK